MHVAIATVGTRGDAQPYVALGKALAARGHRVSLVTHEDHRELAESHGLGFRPACGSFRELLATPAAKRWIESGGSPSRYLETLRETFQPLAMSWTLDFERALEGVDGVLVHGAAFGAMVALQHSKTPYAVIAPYGVLPTKVFYSGLPNVPLLTPWINRSINRWALNAAWRIADEDFRRFLAERGVAKPNKPLWQDQVERGVGHLHLFSEHIVPKPDDWPACAEVTGYCFLDAHPDWSAPRALTDFLATKPAPIYVGFGSMTGMDPEQLASLTRRALSKVKQRAVIGMGWGGMKGFEASDDVMIVDDVPHDWLFPRVAAVVHHCGAGTAAASLRAGRPNVAVPFFGDQPFWAHTLWKLGTAAPPIPKKKLSEDRLARAITVATTNPKLRERAEAVGALLRAEDGAKATAERALHYLGA